LDGPRDPSTCCFEVTFYTDEDDDRGMLLPVAEQHYAKR
jgi:hypothetical protein